MNFSQSYLWPEPLAEAPRYSKLITTDIRSDLPRPAGAFFAANLRARAAAGGCSSCSCDFMSGTGAIGGIGTPVD